MEKEEERETGRPEEIHPSLTSHKDSVSSLKCRPECPENPGRTPLRLREQIKSLKFGIFILSL